MNKHSSSSIDKSIAMSRRIVAILGLILLVCVAILLCVLGWKGCSPSDGSSETDTTAETQAPADTAHVVLPETADAGLAYQDRLTFLGDSLTAHLVSRGVLSGGQDTKQVLRTKTNMLNLDSTVTGAQVCLPGIDRYMTIPEAVAELKPEILVITLGTDYGVAYLTEKDFKACYTKLISAIRVASPDTVLLLQSIFPVTKDCSVLSNDKIDRANGWVREVAAETGCRYLDTQSVLKGSDNCLRPELCISEDGIHLTEEAYRIILGYIRTHAYQE